MTNTKRETIARAIKFALSAYTSDNSKLMDCDLDDAATDILADLEREGFTVSALAALPDTPEGGEVDPVGDATLLAEAVELLADSAEIPIKDIAYHKIVKDLGSQIGFGALMNCATLAWRETQQEKGYPIGSEFTVGHTRVVVEKFIERARTALSAAPAPNTSGLDAAVSDQLKKLIGYIRDGAREDLNDDMMHWLEDSTFDMTQAIRTALGGGWRDSEQVEHTRPSEDVND